MEKGHSTPVQQLRANLELFQTEIPYACKKSAIRSIGKCFITKKYLEEAWDIVGGPAGLAEVMINRSINDVSALCRELGKLPNSHRSLREKKLTELLRVLMNHHSATQSQHLRRAYSQIAVACDEETFVDWLRRSQDLKSTPQKLLRCRGLSSMSEELQSQIFDNFDSSSTEDDMWLVEHFINLHLDVGFQVIKKFTVDKTLVLMRNRRFMPRILLSMQQRCASLKDPERSSEMSYRFWRLSLPCMQMHFAELSKPYFYDGYSTLQYLIERAIPKLISEGPYDDERRGILKQLFKIIPRAVLTEETMLKLIRKTQHVHRYEFLQTYLYHAFSIDIGSAHQPGVELPRGKQKWLTPQLLQLLPQFEALAIMERAITGNDGLECFPPGDGMPPLLQLNPGTWVPDALLLRAGLLQQAVINGARTPYDPKPVLEHMRTTELQRRQTLAEQGRDCETRAFWAKSALCLCSSLQDSQLLLQVLQWLRRFNKDNRTSVAIYGNRMMSSLGYNPMLVVVSREYHSKPDMKALLEEVLCANEAMLALLDTYTLLAQEPDFAKGNFYHMTDACINICRSRLDDYKAFQNRFSLSDDEVYASVLEPTIYFLVEEETRRLKLSRPKNPASRSAFDRKYLHLALPSTELDYRFTDDLIRARDGLYERHRAAVEPAVLKLPLPWPRGLPLQQHVNYLFAGPKLDNKRPEMPYVDGKVSEILFMPRTALFASLSKDKDITNAIGHLVHDWAALVDLYARGTSQEELIARAMRIKNHCINDLRPEGISFEESLRFWKQFMPLPNECEIDMAKDSIPRVSVSTLPFPRSNQKPVKWDPDEIFPDEHIVKGVEKEAPGIRDTSLGSMLQGGIQTWNEHCYCTIPSPTQPNIRKHYWDAVISKESKGNDSAIIAAAILYINHHCGDDASVLATPYPNAENPIFPALYLDTEFLKKQTYNVSRACEALLKCIARVPSDLLLQLVNSMLARFKADSECLSNNMAEFISLLQQLLLTNKRDQALSIVTEVILDFPLQSAWHRQLFRARTLNDMSTSNAEQFITLVVSSCLGRYLTSKQSTMKKNESVKITTFKMIIQAIYCTKALCRDTVVQIVLEILQATDHIDIHNAGLQGLSKMMGPSPGPEVLGVIRNHVAPRASSLNESRPEANEDCAVAEQIGQPLQVLHHEYLDPPLLKWLIHASAGAYNFTGITEQPELTSILLDVIKESTRKNMWWMHMFLQHHGFQLQQGQELPPVPVHPNALYEILQTHISPIQRDIWHMLHEYQEFMKSKPHWLLRITKAIRQRPDIYQSNAGQHWIETWSRTISHARCEFLWLECKLISLSEMEPTSTAQHDMKHLEDFWIGNASGSYGKDLFRDGLSIFDRLKESRVYDISYQRSQRGFLQRTIDFVNSLDSSPWKDVTDWNTRASRTKLKLELLQIQLPRPENDTAWTSEYVLQVYNGIMVLIQRITVSGQPYHHEWLEMKSTLVKDIRNIRCILLLGNPDSITNGTKLGLCDQLRIELVQDMLMKPTPTGRHDIVEGWTKEEWEAVRQMIYNWDAAGFTRYKIGFEAWVHRNLDTDTDNSDTDQDEPEQARPPPGLPGPSYAHMRSNSAMDTHYP